MPAEPDARAGPMGVETVDQPKTQRVPEWVRRAQAKTLPVRAAYPAVVR